jgi:hypothetical protein
MFTRGYAKPPCTRLAYIHGLAVDRVRPYSYGRIRIKGGPLCMQLIFYEV